MVSHNDFFGWVRNKVCVDKMKISMLAISIFMTKIYRVASVGATLTPNKKIQISYFGADFETLQSIVGCDMRRRMRVCRPRPISKDYSTKLGGDGQLEKNKCWTNSQSAREPFLEYAVRGHRRKHAAKKQQLVERYH